LGQDRRIDDVGDVSGVPPIASESARRSNGGPGQLLRPLRNAWELGVRSNRELPNPSAFKGSVKCPRRVNHRQK